MSEGTSGDTNSMELEGVITAEETPVNTLQRLTEDEGTTTRRKKKKKKKEIIYRSDLEVDDAGEGTSADGDGNLGLPFEEGESRICNNVFIIIPFFVILL